MARHSSNVTLQYVEDAWSEAMSTLCEMASSTLARVTQLEKAIENTEKWRSQQLEKLCQTSWGKEELWQEIQSALIPVAITSHQSGKSHRVSKSSCVGNDARLWTTVCGWPSLESARFCAQMFEMENAP